MPRERSPSAPSSTTIKRTRECASWELGARFTKEHIKPSRKGRTQFPLDTRLSPVVLHSFPPSPPTWSSCTEMAAEAPSVPWHLDTHSSAAAHQPQGHKTRLEVWAPHLVPVISPQRPWAKWCHRLRQKPQERAPTAVQLCRLQSCCSGLPQWHWRHWWQLGERVQAVNGEQFSCHRIHQQTVAWGAGTLLSFVLLFLLGGWREAGAGEKKRGENL